MRAPSQGSRYACGKFLCGMWRKTRAQGLACAAARPSLRPVRAKIGNICLETVVIRLPADRSLTFAVGRYMQPSPPPLIIQRAANSPLSDAPVNPNDTTRPTKQPNGSNPTANVSVATADDAVYICGARTQKGTPCHRRVHVAGERCFQHKGMAAMAPLEKLKITP